MNQQNTSLASDSRARWWQLFFGIVAMIAISSPQYVWALFTTELTASLGVTLTEDQITFAILIVAIAACGNSIDRSKPRFEFGIKNLRSRLNIAN